MALHLIDYNAIFIHIPKTGGTFVRHVLTDVLKLRTEEVGYKHSHPNLIGKIALEGKYMFAFTRDPIEWYKSYFKMKYFHFRNRTFGEIYEPGLLWHPTWKIDRYCWSHYYEEFVQNVETRYPGFVKNMFREYCTDLSYTGKQGILINDLCTVFSLLGIPHDPAHLSSLSRENEALKYDLSLGPECSELVRKNNAVLST